MDRENSKSNFHLGAVVGMSSISPTTVKSEYKTQQTENEADSKMSSTDP